MSRLKLFLTVLLLFSFALTANVFADPAQPENLVVNDFDEPISINDLDFQQEKAPIILKYQTKDSDEVIQVKFSQDQYENTIIESEELNDSLKTKNTNEEIEKFDKEPIIIPMDEFFKFPTTNNPKVLFLFLPLLGFIFIRISEGDPNSVNYRKFGSLALASLLIVWTVAIPGTIGISYWGIAYAEEDLIPNELHSLHFDELYADEIIFEGNAIIGGVINPYLILDGKDSYLRFNATDTLEKLKHFTLSAWVKPNFNEGSQIFTIVSKEKSFNLGINKLDLPNNLAKISIFDGIKWNTLKSTSQIKEEWTHIAATFDGIQLTLFVDGVEQSSLFFYQEVGYSKPGSDVIVGAYSYVSRSEEHIVEKFAGQIDAIKIFDSALSVSQINDLYNINRASDPPVTEESIDSEEIIEVEERSPNKYGFIPDDEQTDETAQEIDDLLRASRPPAGSRRRPERTR
ncbi:MAG: LamG domain-containing protein [Thaumarchaeota archaeon]|nr:LamG domain-containing protein [Nitrososphaerota archaeon]